VHRRHIPAQKFAVNNRQKGTDAENRAVLESMVAGFGNYTVEADTVTVLWVASSFPNRIDTQEKRTYKITGENLVATNPTGSSGGVSISTYIRVK
jgi:Lipocalin-like domain